MRRAVESFAVAAALAIAMRPGAMMAQESVRRLVLKPPTATHPEEFSSINAVRELGDGRVLVADGRENRMLVLDFTVGTATRVSRAGRGPNEYVQIGAVHAIADDSTIMWDMLARRYLILAGARAVVTVPPDDPAMRLRMDELVVGADELGRLLVLRPPLRREGITETGTADSAALTLVDRSSGRVDTVARLWNAPRVVTVHYNADGSMSSRSAPPIKVMAADEKALLLADGRLAIARLSPFRIDWRSPEGEWTRGVPLPLRAVPFDARERAAYSARLRANAARNRARPGDLPPPPLAPSAFPEFVPPVTLSTDMMSGPAGTLLIQRARSSTITGNHYLVIDRGGRLLGEIALPLERTIIGAGPNSIYVTVKDEDDVLRIQRHPWP